MTKKRVSVCDLSPDEMEVFLLNLIDTVLEWRAADSPDCDSGLFMVKIDSMLQRGGLLDDGGISIIDSFRGEYDFLSNFYPAAIHYDGKLYATTEHAFQAAKTLDPEEREKIRRAETPGTAKKMSKEILVRKDWYSIRFGVMLDVIRKKFQHPELRERLLKTGDAKLIEGNTWNDTTWGVCNGKGKNWLGRILMQVRKEIQEAEVAQW